MAITVMTTINNDQIYIINIYDCKIFNMYIDKKYIDIGKKLSIYIYIGKKLSIYTDIIDNFFPIIGRYRRGQQVTITPYLPAYFIFSTTLLIEKRKKGIKNKFKKALIQVPLRATVA